MPQSLEEESAGASRDNAMSSKHVQANSREFKGASRLKETCAPHPLQKVVDFNSKSQ